MASQYNSRRSRRTYLKTIAVTSTIGLAGCAGQGDGSGGDGGGGGNDTGNGSDGSSGGNDTGNGSDGGGGTTNSSGDWSDLSGKKVHVVIDETADPIKNFWDGAANDFKNATNADIRVEYVGRQTSGVQRVTQLIQSGTPPEIFAMSQTNATSFQSQDILAPVSDVMADIQDRLGTAYKQVKWDGEHWTVPTFLNVVAWYWRGDLAEEVDMDRRPNWTWEKATEYAQKVNELDGVDGTYVPAGSGDHAVYHLRSWLRTAECSITKWDGDKMVVNFQEGQNREKMIQTLKFLKGQHQYSPVASDSGFTSWARTIPNQVSGSGNYIGYRPKMYAIQDDRDFAADVHAAQMPKKNSRMTDGNIDGLGTFKGSNVDAAKTFMRFITQKEQLLPLYELNPVHDVPAFPGIRESDEYQSFLDGLPEAYTPKDTVAYQERVATNFVSSIGGTEPPNPYAGIITGADPLPNLVSDVILNDANPDSVIDQYAQELQSVLDNAQS
jgi:ABC-type glycerol-3-phosphate transport system substrate-binding protein